MSMSRKELEKLYKNLFSLNRSIVSEENLYALDYISENYPVKIHTFNGGENCFDWVVPRCWKLLKGQIKNLNGEVVYDVSDNTLRILNFSNSFSSVIKKEELDSHIFTLPDSPETIPYRTSYYSEGWGFCMPHNTYKTLNDKEYEVIIETEFNDTPLVVGELSIGPKNAKEVILTSYFCHPKQANDGLSGVIMLLKLYDLLKDKKNLKYRYRLFFLPETIGSICLLSNKIIEPKNVEFGLVSTCVGLGDCITYKRTFVNNHTLDNVVNHVLRNSNNDYEIRDYWPNGSDERQFSSPGVEIPTGALMRTPFEEFKEYHTSEDNLELVSIDLIEKMAYIYYKILSTYEVLKYPKVFTDGGETFLSKHKLYRSVGVPGHTEEGRIISWILHLSNGKNSLVDISIKSGYNLRIIEDLTNKLLKKKVVWL